MNELPDKKDYLDRVNHVIILHSLYLIELNYF